jgi:hypothetical protein
MPLPITNQIKYFQHFALNFKNFPHHKPITILKKIMQDMLLAFTKTFEYFE